MTSKEQVPCFRCRLGGFGCRQKIIAAPWDHIASALPGNVEKPTNHRLGSPIAIVFVVFVQPQRLPATIWRPGDRSVLVCTSRAAGPLAIDGAAREQQVRREQRMRQ
jgi:hypothetical protein